MELLQSLYKEYLELHSKLRRVKDLIIMYGGVVPSTEIEDAQMPPQELIHTLGVSFFYPSKASWKDKILFVLDQVGLPLTTGEIVHHLQDQESHKTHKQLSSIVRQYCSNLSKGEDAVLVAHSDENNYRNTYSIKK